MAGSGFKEPLRHSPAATVAPYAYRSNTGMVPSAEHAVYFDDFFGLGYDGTQVAPIGAVSIEDTGAAWGHVAASSDNGQGVLSITSDGTAEGCTAYWPGGVRVGLGKKFFMEVRMKTEDADDTDMQFGIADDASVTNPEDLFTTAATDLIALGVIDGSANLVLLTDKSNGGDAAQDTGYDVSDDTWATYAIEVDGLAANSDMSVKVYVNGNLTYTADTETTIPDDLILYPFIGGRTGGAAGHDISFDYVRWSVTRQRVGSE